jgi:hypothetical protein
VILNGFTPLISPTSVGLIFIDFSHMLPLPAQAGSRFRDLPKLASSVSS